MSSRHPANNGRAMLVAWIDPALRDSARVRAADSGVSVSDHVAEALRRYGLELDMARIASAKCPHCVHEPHRGMCTGRNGGTAYPCPCHHSTGGEG